MKCPHCRDGIHEAWIETGNITQDIDHDYFAIRHMKCPSCGKVIAYLIKRTGGNQLRTSRLIVPKAPSREALSTDVPTDFAGDYSEACLVLGDSPKASAALSRRCLQHLLREKAYVKHSNLDNEIQQVIDGKTLPSHLTEALDAVRVIGNFAAHPIKSTSTGEVVAVEDGEAEWQLDTLEGLFDFYFVQPAILQKKRNALNKKLADAGKPSLK